MAHLIITHDGKLNCELWINRSCPLTFCIRNAYRIRKWDQINLVHSMGCKSAMTWELFAIKHLYATEGASPEG